MDRKKGWSATVLPASGSFAEAHLDLVKDDDGADLPSPLNNLGQPLHLGLVQTSLPLNRLDDDTARVVVDELVESLLDIDLSDLDSGKQRRKGILVLGVGGDG